LRGEVQATGRAFHRPAKSRHVRCAHIKGEGTAQSEVAPHVSKCGKLIIDADEVMRHAIRHQYRIEPRA
jgi:hypothetical protein